MTVLGTLYCMFSDERNQYKNFYPNKISVKMCGCEEENVLKVELIEVREEQAEYWGWYDNVKKECKFVYKYIESVKICSDTFFEKEVATGLGRFVPLRVQVINS